MFYNKVTNRKTLRKFKKRGLPSMDSDYKVKKGFTYVWLPKGGNIELAFYKRILRRFRRRVRRRKYKVLFRFLPNYSYTRKIKNSRMGKGKGRFSRLALKLTAFKVIMIIKGLSHRRVECFLKKLRSAFKFNFLISNSRLRLGGYR